MLERACALTGDPALGIYLGMQMQASAHGILGYAAMTAGTVREAIRISVRYMAIRTTAVSLRTQLGDDVATLILDEHADLGGASQGYAFAILIGCWRVGSVFAGRPLTVTLDFAFPRPAYFRSFRRRSSSGPVRPTSQSARLARPVHARHAPADGRQGVAPAGPRSTATRCSSRWASTAASRPGCDPCWPDGRATCPR